MSNCQDIDFIAIGEGENSIVALAAYMQSKDKKILESIKSFGRDEDGSVKNKQTKKYMKIRRSTNAYVGFDLKTNSRWILIIIITQ